MQESKALVKFKKELKGELFLIDAEVRLAMVIAARYAIRKIIEYSPVWSGSYIKSHRVNRNAKDISYEPFVTSNNPAIWNLTKLSNAAAEALKSKILDDLFDNIFKIKVGDKVTISNSIPYAKDVEFIGWKATPAYHVYGKTRLAFIANKKRFFVSAAAQIKLNRNRMKMKRASDSEINNLAGKIN